MGQTIVGQTMGPFRTIFESRAQRVGWIVSAALLLLLGFLPLLGGPRYEAALIAGLVVPTVAAIASAFDVAGRCRAWPPVNALLRGLTAGAVHGLLLLGVGLVHGLRLGFCEPGAGFLLLVLGPGAGALLAGLWGALVGTALCHRPRRRLLLVLGAFSLPLLTAVASLLRFLTSPMVFAFDPFVGYFAGPLYETVEIPIGRLLSYRAGSLMTVLTALAAALLFEWPEGSSPGSTPDGSAAGSPAGSPNQPERSVQRLRLRRPFDRRLLVAVPLFGSLSVGLAAAGGSLGHFSTEGSIRAALGGQLEYGRCDVVYADGLGRGDVLRLARECDAHVAQIERYFGARGPERITVYLFESAAQKGLLMGAASTYIAKPWRREVYLQPAGFPHPVLGHELAHVISGSFASGPFRVAGPLGGWIPDPGRIEGVAVAAAFRDDGDVGLEEWAAAMRQVKLLPPLQRVFRLSFLGESSARAYTVAGAFMAWLHQEHGAEVVRRWYGGDSLEMLTGASLPELEARWHARLDSVRLPEQLLHEASARFERPAIFGRQCPHIVDRLYYRARQWLNVRDPKRARETLHELLELDPHHGGATLLLPACTLREGRADAAFEEYRSIAVNTQWSSAERAQAWEGAGDAAFLLRQDEQAFDAYTQALEMTVGAHGRRALEVKRWALRSEPHLRRSIELLLVGPATTGPQWDLGAPELGRWVEAGPYGAMASYLIGRNLLARSHYREAAAWLEQAVVHSGRDELPLPSVRTEALRSAFLARCALADPVRAQGLYDLLVEEPLTLGQRRGIARIAERCGVEPGLVAPRPNDPTRPPVGAEAVDAR